MKKFKKNKKQEMQKQNIKAAFGCLGVILASILFIFFLAFIFSSESSKGTLSESKTSKHLSDEIAKKIEHQLNDRFNNEYLKEFKVEYDTFVFTPIDKTRIKLDAFVRDPKNESKAGEWYKQQGNLIHFSGKYYKEEKIESKFSIVNPNDTDSILITFEKGEPTYVFLK